MYIPMLRFQCLAWPGVLFACSPTGLWLTQREREREGGEREREREKERKRDREMLTGNISFGDGEEEKLLLLLLLLPFIRSSILRHPAQGIMETGLSQYTSFPHALAMDTSNQRPLPFPMRRFENSQCRSHDPWAAGNAPLLYSHGPVRATGTQNTIRRVETTRHGEPRKQA